MRQRRFFLACLLLPFAAAEVKAGAIDLARAVIVVPDGLSSTESKAVHVLIDEVHKRSRIGWESMIRWPTRSVPVIAVGPARLVDSLPKEFRQLVSSQSTAQQQDGFRIQTVSEIGAVARRGHRGQRCPRSALWRRSAAARAASRSRPVLLPQSINLASAPKYRLRGHQLGYRPKTNSYDAWDLPQWDRYIRELAIFGTNAIELIPPRSDDAASSPHFPLPPMEMMAGMSQICADYGLDVWIWYPAMDADYADPKTVEHALAEWAEVFKKLPRIDAVFVPGGDPGHTRPKVLMALLEKQAENLHRYHPKAQMWVSPQSFSREWFDEFLKLMATEPAWLAGVVFGPQVRVSLPELRKAIPAKYPIRDYPGHHA